MVEEIADRLMRGLQALGSAAKLSALVMLGATLHVIGQLERRGRRGRRAAARC